MRDPAIGRLLFDSDATIALEAARAIYDLNIESQMPMLAALGDRFCEHANTSQTNIGAFTQQDPRTLPLLRRIIAANRLVANAEAANRLAELSQSTRVSPTARMLAFESLAQWAAPVAREPVHGRVIDIDAKTRDEKMWKRALALSLPMISSSSPDETLRGKARELGHLLKISVQVRSFEVMCQMIHSGLGVGILPADALRPMASALGLCLIPLDESWAVRHIDIGIPANAETTQSLQRLLQALIPTFETETK
jgi:hypothetical protein